MIKSSKRFAIVRETSAQSFEAKLNETLDTLSEANPTVTFSETGDYMIARIEYTETVSIPSPAPSETGIRLHCEDCPYFEQILKGDGSQDGRVKYGDCPFAEFGRTWKTSAACDILYRAIDNGEVKLCFSV